MATFNTLEPPLPPGSVAPPKPPGLVGGPAVLARNFAVMTGVNAGLQCAIKKARGGVEDVQGRCVSAPLLPSLLTLPSMAASFGAGAAFSLVSSLGTPAAAAPAALLMDAARTGAVFSLLQGAFYQVGNMLSGATGGKKTAETDFAFVHTNAMLATLGLTRFEKNFRKGELDDLTLPLLTDSALKEVRIPPGPRLRILQYAAYARTAHAATPRAQAQPNVAVGPLGCAELCMCLPAQ